MNLEQYFKKIQSHKLSETQKSALYERILLQTQKPQTSIFSRMRFYGKIAWYTLVLWVIGLSIYGSYIGQQNQTATNIASTVYADYIAKVVTTQWDYYIESAGNRIEWSNISDGDTIVLAKDSSLIVHVGDHVEGKITGPAKFVVRRQDAWFAITLEEGDYIEVSTLGDQSSAPQVALVSVNHKFTARTNAGKGFHFVLTEKNDQPLVVNKSGEEITIINEQENGKTQTTLLAQNRSIEVWETVIVANGAGPHTVATILAANTQNSDTSADADYNNGFFRNMLLASSDAQAGTETAKQQPEAMTVSDTQAGTETTTPSIDSKEVRSNLIPQFVWVDVKYITYYYLNGQTHEYHVAYENFLKRLYNLYGAMNLEVPENSRLTIQEESYKLQNLTVLATYLRQNLPTSVPNHQANTLATLINVLQKLQTQDFGSYKWQGLNVDEMFAKIQ